jgi:hypothetical protein
MVEVVVAVGGAVASKAHKTATHLTRSLNNSGSSSSAEGDRGGRGEGTGQRDHPPDGVTARPNRAGWQVCQGGGVPGAPQKITQS